MLRWSVMRWVVALPLLCAGFSAAAASCNHPGPVTATGAMIADVASREQREFGGHVIGHDGSFGKFGAVESESELLHDPETGLPAADRSGRFAWRRVWAYWLALDRHAEGEALSRKVLFVPGLLEDPDTSERTRELTLDDLFHGLDKTGPDINAALRQAAVRATLNDSAWSAAFIAYLMDAAQLSNAQFRYSAAHALYIQRAFAAPAEYAFRACDPRKTIPRPGDLLCYSRGATPLKNFAAWQAATARPHFRVASHCDAVVAVDLAANKIDTVGGNVLQSVTRRSLKLNAAHRLSASYDPDRAARNARHCAKGTSCGRENFNVQYWGVLLQLQ